MPGVPKLVFLDEDIVELNSTFKELPGKLFWSTLLPKYGEYIVSPWNTLLSAVTKFSLFERITEEVLPYLSDNTTPTWYVLFCFTVLFGYSTIETASVSSLKAVIVNSSSVPTVIEMFNLILETVIPVVSIIWAEAPTPEPETKLPTLITPVGVFTGISVLAL